MNIFKYSNKLYNGNGEGFFFHDKNSALSFFHYPNNDKLQGIGLHVHPECDDIDVLVEGELYVSNDFKNFKKITAPCIIANLSGIPHAILRVKNKTSLMYGMRSPFKGGVQVDPAQLKNNKKSQVFSLMNYISKGEHLLLKSKYSRIYLHVDQSHIPKRNKNHSRIIINLSKDSIQLGDNEKTVEVNSIINDTKFEKLPIKEHKSLIVELISCGEMNE